MLSVIIPKINSNKINKNKEINKKKAMKYTKSEVKVNNY